MVTALSRFGGKWSQRNHVFGGEMVTAMLGVFCLFVFCFFVLLLCCCFLWGRGEGHSDVTFWGRHSAVTFCGEMVTAMSRFLFVLLLFWGEVTALSCFGGNDHNTVTFWGEMVTALSRFLGEMVTALSRFGTHASTVACTWSRCCLGRRGHSSITFVDTWSVNCHRTHGQ